MRRSDGQRSDVPRQPTLLPRSRRRTARAPGLDFSFFFCVSAHATTAYSSGWLAFFLSCSSAINRLMPSSAFWSLMRPSRKR